MLEEAYFEANALYPKTNKFGDVSSLKVYQGLPRNAGLPFLVSSKVTRFYQMFWSFFPSQLEKSIRCIILPIKPLLIFPPAEVIGFPGSNSVNNFP